MQHIKRRKDKNHSITSIDEKKPSTKYNILSCKTYDETRNTRNVAQHNKGYIWQAYSQHHTK
jgi:hypothetical protein